MKIDADRCEFEAALAQETNDCAVRAIAIATQTDYSEVRSIMRNLGRKDRAPSDTEHVALALHMIGYNAINIVTGNYIIPERYDDHRGEIDPPKNRKHWTFRSMMNALDRSERYMILSRNHIAAAINGTIEDWSADRLFRVVGVWKIIKR